MHKAPSTAAAQVGGHGEMGQSGPTFLPFYPECPLRPCESVQESYQMQPEDVCQQTFSWEPGWLWRERGHGEEREASLAQGGVLRGGAFEVEGLREPKGRARDMRRLSPGRGVPSASVFYKSPPQCKPKPDLLSPCQAENVFADMKTY